MKNYNTFIKINENLKYMNILDKIHDKYIIEDNVYKILKLILNGEQSYAFHGTNREFDKFEPSQVRKWRADKFLGEGIFLTPNKDIAIKYANANANVELPITLLDDAKKIDKELYDFMYSLYYKGNIAWQLPEFEKFVSSTYDKEKQTFIYNNKFNVDCNDIAEIVNLIPGSKSYDDYNKDSKNDDGFFNIFGTSSSALNETTIKLLKELGFGDYSPKIFTVLINGTTSVLMSKNVSEIKNSKKYDIIIAYNVPNLIKDVPEIIIHKPELLNIISKVKLD